jgi:predicted nucleic acid-binding protein
VDEGAIAICRIVVLELLRAARDAQDFALARAHLDRLRDAPIRRREWDRALDVTQALAGRGPLHHRQVPFQDLVVAAAAEAAEVPVLHYDRHFELIAEVTGQEVRLLAPLGSL